MSVADSTILPRSNATAALVEGIILSWGWKRRAIAFVSGAVGALALPPLSLFPLIAAPLTIAVWLIDGAQDRRRGRTLAASLKAAFGAGWWMGFGYFLAGLWWVGSALLVEADKFAWALPLAVVALPAVLAVFPAAGFVLARLLWSPGPARVFALAFGLGVAEWARGLLFTGFPWNDLGMALGVNLTLAQTASLVGLHGLTFLAIAIFAAPATLWRVSESRVNLTPTIVAALALAAIAVFGALRLAAPPSAMQPGVKLRLIQPNIGQDDASFSPENRDAILRRYFDLSERAASPDRSGVRDVTDLIWPESAFPFILSRDPQALSDIADFLKGGATLITGAARREDGGGRAPRYFNSIEIVSRDGLSGERYDKQHLVPFGEYIPFASLLERAGVTQMVDIPGGFEAGSGPPYSPCSGPAGRHAAHLLRGDLSHRAWRPLHRRRAAGLAPQRHRRRLVRHDPRALSALCAGAAAGDRAGAAAGARRQFGHLGGGRRPRARNRGRSAWRRGRPRRRPARSAPAHLAIPLRIGRRDGDRAGVFGRRFDWKAPRVKEDRRL